MNVLFLTRNEVSPFRGGTERITHTLSNGLKSFYDHKCFSSFFVAEKFFKLTLFDGKIQLSRFSFERKIHKFIVENSITHVIIQGEFRLAKKVRKSILDVESCKIIFVHHFSPGYEENFASLLNTLNILKFGSFAEKKNAIFKLLIYPYLRWQALLNPTQYNTMYHNVDIVVLLSSRFIPEFVKYGKIVDVQKIKIIPNVLSFDFYLEENAFQYKDKTVLIVSRLDEPPKRLSLALEIWRMVKEYPIAKDWKLDIIGHGPNQGQYENYVFKYDLKDVHFLGAMNPVERYKLAAIFMMTSRSEGWGLTLTEAQQFGCVPIAFDSYLSLHDIITDGVNGCIIPDNDVISYVHAVLDLMSDSCKLCSIARNAILSSKRFALESIIKKWNSILES